MVAEWSPAEDLRPAKPLLAQQPEATARGRVWTQLATFDFPMGDDGRMVTCYTQLTIRECSGDYLIGHGRVWPLVEDDGA